MKESRFVSVLSALIDVIWAGFLWLVCSLPLVTLGASSTALYYVTVKCIRHERGRTSKSFFQAFRSNFRQATLLWLLLLGYVLIGLADLYALGRMGVQPGNPLYYISRLFFLPALLLFPWLFSFLSRFHNSVKGTLKFAAYLAMRYVGEYLPADAVCRGGSGLVTHNQWPMLWAKCNREAVEEAGKLGDCVFFMRAGAAGSQKYSTLLWAGDQCVDWSEDDGLPSVITAALSAGLSGFGLHTCDIGGYTTLFHLHRDEELLRRWLEFACFTPVMRTHEGNRPDSNVQLYDSAETLTFAARLTAVHDRLLPYFRRCVAENAERGLPVMRPLFFAAPEHALAWSHLAHSCLLGGDLLVAPVVEPAATSRRVFLPEGDWVHLWSGRRYAPGEHEVPAPLGEPPAFYRAGSDYAELFASLRE